MSKITPDEFVQDFNGEKKLTDIELLTKFCNFTRSLMMERISLYNEAKMRFEQDPSYSFSNGQRIIRMDDVVKERRALVLEALSTNKAFETLRNEMIDGKIETIPEKYLDPSIYVEVTLPEVIDPKHLESNEGEQKSA